MRYLPWMFLAPKNVAFQGRELWKSRVKLLIKLKIPGPDNHLEGGHWKRFGEVVKWSSKRRLSDEIFYWVGCTFQQHGHCGPG